MGTLSELFPAIAGAEPTPRPATPVQVRVFSSDIAEQWEEFVRQQPLATFFHSLGWKRAVEQSFGYEACYWYAERAGRITGILPLFLVRNWAVGRCLVSVPQAVYGGICAEDGESAQALLESVKEHAVAGQVDFLELRNRKSGLYPEFHPNPLYVTFGTELSADEQANLKRLPRDTRYMIRKGEKAGLTARRGMEQLDVFYRLFAYSVRRLGTPVFSRRWFENLAQEFSGRMDLLVIYAGNEPVSGVLSFFFRDAILPYYAGAGPKANALAANNFMYWELMKQAVRTGIRFFDFGRSKKGTGSYAFKTQWNMEMTPLDYQVFLVRRKSVPNFNPLNPKIQLAARLWKQMPLWATLKLGPRVVRWFP